MIGGSRVLLRRGLSPQNLCFAQILFGVIPEAKQEGALEDAGVVRLRRRAFRRTHQRLFVRE